MRISLTGWRSSTLGIVTAFACASGLHLSGCARSSSREVSADLSKKAAETAAKAERAIAARNARQPLIGGKSDTNLARQSASKKYSTSERNPLAELLAAQKDTYPGGDPFIAESRKTPKSSELSRNNLPARNQSALASHEKSRTDRSHVQLTQHVNQSTLGTDGSAIAKPISPREFPKNSTQAEKSDELVGRIQLSDRIQSQAKIQTEKKPAEAQNQVESIIAESKSSVEQLQAWKNDLDYAESDIGFWQKWEAEQKVGANQNDNQQSVSKLSSSPHAVEVQREHVHALIRQSGLQHSRGELHAAYRSALLAKQLVEKNGLSLAKDEVDPATIVQEISAQIWGSAQKKQVIAEKQPEPVEEQQLPIIIPRQRRSAQHDQVFKTPDSFLNWQASTLQSQQESDLDGEQTNHSHVSTEDEGTTALAVNNSSPQVAPIIRSELHQTETDAQPGIQQTSATELETSSDENWLAVDQFNSEQVPSLTLIPEDQERSFLPAPKPFPQKSNSLIADASEIIHSTTLTTPNQRPLLAPQVETNPFAANLERLDLPVAEEFPIPAVAAKSEPVEQVTTTSPQDRLKWAVVAFILATISTLIGLKVNRTPKKDDSQNQEEEPAADEESSSIKISQAA